MLRLWIYLTDISGATPGLPWFEKQCELIAKNQFSVSEKKKQLEDRTQKFYMLFLFKYLENRRIKESRITQ